MLLHFLRSIKILFNGLRKEWKENHHHHHLNDKMHFSLNPSSIVVVSGEGGGGGSVFSSLIHSFSNVEYQTSDKM